jgi:hypothetical protein
MNSVGIDRNEKMQQHEVKERKAKQLEEEDGRKMFREN